MPAAQQQHPIHFDVSESEIDRAIAACDGDPRAVIRALMIAQARLEGELSRARAQSSLGYTRGRAKERAS
ncbi:hypothetical protein [Castellaniella sp.]|uniref:hypothetical protein n=1 Tax=Castellaniella sp. TaxID=1955812 RepID=UPI002AFE226F|nr:hypothetical protein [Castellaniella sp.]